MKVSSLDRTDQKILELLLDNARMSYVAIGKEVSLSRVAVKARIDELERRGILQQYSVIVNADKIGRAISVFFDVEVDPRRLYEVAEELKSKECITDIYVMTGKSSLHVHAMLPVQEDLEKFLLHELNTIPGIKNVECQIILSRIKARKGLTL